MEELTVSKTERYFITLNPENTHPASLFELCIKYLAVIKIKECGQAILKYGPEHPKVDIKVIGGAEIQPEFFDAYLNYLMNYLLQQVPEFSLLPYQCQTRMQIQPNPLFSKKKYPPRKNLLLWPMDNKT